MGSFDGLRRKVNADVNRGFGRAVKRMEEASKADPATPVDTGALRRGMESQVLVLTGTTKKARLRSTATNGPFDYPGYLNARKRRYLNGNSNIHFEWWKRTVTIEKWIAALKAELDGNIG